MSFRAKRRNLFLHRREGIPLQPVAAAAGAGQALPQPLAAFAHPADLPGGHAYHQGVILHVAGHHGPGGDERRTADRVAADYGTVGSQGSPLAHARACVYTVYREMGPRSNYIREYTRGPTKNIVLEFNALVNGDVVLDAATVPDPDVVADVHVLPQRTVPTDDSSLLDVAEMPNFGSSADGDPIVDIAARVYEKVLHRAT